ncbi:MAG: extracellular solute-binding protein [Cohnella sp.]|nr:extracellular solute-binding protein [Cohnella sp.]
MTKNRWKQALAPLVLSATLLAGCTLGAGGKDTAKNSQPETLKVMYYDDRSFFDQYGMLFSALHPEVEIEVVSTQSVKYEPGKDMNAEMLKFIQEQKPDVLMLTPEQLTKFSGEGKLMELDSNVDDKAFDKAGVLPGMLDYLKEQGGGKLYGLVPNFNSQAIFYNKDLFQKYGVELPKDKMSWEDLLRLAARFPTTGSKQDRVYGLKTGYNGGDVFQLANMIGMTQNLSYVNPASMQVTINTDAWKKTFETAITAMKSGSLYTQDPNRGGGPQSYEDYLLQDPFISGKLAMTMDGAYIIDQLKQAQSVVKDKAIKNWDIVTMPVDPSNPDVSPNVSLSQIFAIPADSPKSKAAWTFLNYIMSDEFARVTSKRQQGQMSVRTQYLKDKEGHHFEAFYSLKPIQPAMYQNYDKIPQDFQMNFMGIAQQELKSATDGQKTVSDALNALQTKGQEALIQAKQKQDAKPKGTTGTSSSTTTTTTTSG